MRTHYNPRNMTGETRFSPRRPSRRRGVVALYVAGGLMAFLGIAALVVDMGNLYARRAQAQRAADAAALAGALEMASALQQASDNNTTPDLSSSKTTAIQYAGYNGYTTSGSPTNGNVTVYPARKKSSGTGYESDPTLSPRYFLASVSRDESLYFLPAVAALVGKSASTKRVGATAVAQVAIGTHRVGQSINGAGRYGMNEGPTNPSIFGIYAKRYNGDKYSPIYYSDGKTLNTEHRPNGYDYIMSIDQGYIDAHSGKKLQLEIFDPNTNNGGSFGGWDEMWNSSGNQDVSGNEETKTVFSLYPPPNSGLPEDVPIATKTYGREMTDEKGNSINEVWVTPDGFVFDPSTYGPGSYRINVNTTAGAAENGFNLRAGPERGAGEEFDPDNGTMITADGSMPMNFTKSGTSVINLGNVPADAAGGTLYINKFDTDVGSVSVEYTCTGLPGQKFPGVLAGNDQEKMDQIKLPVNYPGGDWFVNYIAGAQDTSVWEMSYENTIPGRPSGPSSVRLVD